MAQMLGLISLLVRDYDEAGDSYVGRLGFRLIEDTGIPDEGKRWVVVSPAGEGSCRILLAQTPRCHQSGRNHVLICINERSFFVS